MPNPQVTPTAEVTQLLATLSQGTPEDQLAVAEASFQKMMELYKPPPPDPKRSLFALSVEAHWMNNINQASGNRRQMYQLQSECRDRFEHFDALQTKIHDFMRGDIGYNRANKGFGNRNNNSY